MICRDISPKKTYKRLISSREMPAPLLTRTTQIEITANYPWNQPSGWPNGRSRIITDVERMGPSGTAGGALKS